MFVKTGKKWYFYGMDKNPIDKETLDHLSRLARVQISSEQQAERLLRDAENILRHFDELQQVNTDDVSPVYGGGELQNVVRADETDGSLQGKGYSDFPETKDNYLEVPAVREK